MLCQRVDGVLEAGDGSSVKAERGVGTELGLDLIGTGRAGRTAEDVVDAAALLAAIAEGDDHLGLEALRELCSLEG